MMDAREMLGVVQDLKEKTIINGFEKPKEVDGFFADNWMQILDILDDALHGYLLIQGKESE